MKTRKTAIFSLFFVIFSFSCNFAVADLFFSIGGDRRKIDPILLNQFVAIDNSGNLWADLNPNPTYHTHYDLNGQLSLLSFGPTNLNLRVGAYGRYTPPNSVEARAKLLSNGLVYTYKTTYTGFTLGPWARLSLPRLGDFQFFVNAGIGFGSVKLEQSATSASSAAVLSASALSAEQFADFGLGYELTRGISLEGRFGLAREKTNLLSVNSAAGYIYSAFKPGDRLLVGNKELQVIRSGTYFTLALSFSL